MRKLLFSSTATKMAQKVNRAL